MINLLQVLKACEKADYDFKHYFGRAPGLPRTPQPIGIAQELMLTSGASFEACEAALWDANERGFILGYYEGAIQAYMTPKGRGWLFMLAAPQDEFEQILALRNEIAWRAAPQGQGASSEAAELMEAFRCQQ